MWSGYDGRDYLDSINAEEGYCKTAEGHGWIDNWRNFRMNYAGCLGTEKACGIGAKRGVPAAVPANGAASLPRGLRVEIIDNGPEGARVGVPALGCAMLTI